MDERLDELEIKVAHQERLLSDLDEVVKAFTAKVAKLERELSELRETAGGLPVGDATEPPPHY